MKYSISTFMILLTASVSILTGSAQSEEVNLPDGPFPSVLLDENMVRGDVVEDASLLNPVEYSGTLNIRINQDNTLQLQNEEQIVTNPVNPDNLVAVWRDFRLGYRRVGYAASFDGGITWTEDLFEEPTYPWHSDPGLTVDAEGNFFAVILSYTSTYEPNGLYVYKSSDGGLSWGDPVEVINGVPNVFEDKELIGCDRTGGTHDGNLYVTWARFGYTTDIMISRSIDGGQSFTSATEISDVSSVQWPVPVVGADGVVNVAWVNYYPSSIKFDQSTDGGASFGTDRTIAMTSLSSDYINGGIWIFAYPAMEADITGGSHHGNLYVAYTDYGPGSDTDIFFKRSTNGGASWIGPLRINDDSPGNGRDQFHPWTTVDETGLISVVFLDRRNDSNNYFYDCYMTQSDDGGVTWSENIRLSDVSSDPQAGQVTAGLLGEYIGVTSSYGRVNALWTDTRRGHQDAFTARVYTDPSVDIQVIPESTSLTPGDDLSYTVHVTNTTGENVDFWGAGYVTLPWGDPFGFGPVDGPAPIHLGPFGQGQVVITHRLPNSTPAGRYYYTLRAAQLPYNMIDEDTFNFTVEAP
jgi:hypothetical protein